MARHPSDALLFDHGRGVLPIAAILPISAHLELCPACRAAHELWDLVRRAVLSPGRDDGRPGAVSPDRADPVAAPKSSKSALGEASLYGAAWPQSIASYKISWRRWIAPGVWLAHIRAPSRDGWRVFALGVRAGGQVPSHGHRGSEFIHVFHGAMEANGLTYRTGDFLELKAGEVHRLRVVGDGPCICLIASEAPLIWRGWLRLFKLWIGI